MKERIRNWNFYVCLVFCFWKFLWGCSSFMSVMMKVMLNYEVREEEDEEKEIKLGVVGLQ
jgi:hypothetical protein